MAYLNYSDADDARMEEDPPPPPPPRTPHPNSAGPRIEPYPRGGAAYHNHHAATYGTYEGPGYSYYGHQQQQHHYQNHHHQQHGHPRAAPPPALVASAASRAYLDATGASAGYLDHHWGAQQQQQPFDVAADGAHHAQGARPPVPLAPAPTARDVGRHGVAGGVVGTRRRSSAAMGLSLPMSPTSAKSEDAANLSFGMGDDGASSMSRNSNGAPTDPLKRFQCMQLGCDAAFARKADRDRHRVCVHEKSENKNFPCPEANCSRTGASAFTRKDHLMEHLRNYHHQDIPKKKRAKDGKDQDVWFKEEERM